MHSDAEKKQVAFKDPTPRKAVNEANENGVNGGTGVNEAKVKVSSTFKNVAATLAVVGVGSSAGFYLAAVGFFQHRFQSNELYLGMLMALYIPYPITVLLQEAFDDYFDRRHSPRVTYCFRVVVLQVLTIAGFAAYAFSYGSPLGVLACGVVIGFLSAAGLSSTMILLAAWDPILPAWATLGRYLGGLLPVVAYSALGFQASKSSTWEFQRMQMVPALVLGLCALGCTALHCTGVWDRAYQKLGLDLYDSDDFEYDLEGVQRSISATSFESEPLIPPDEAEDASGTLSWLVYWRLAIGYNCFMSFMVLPLVSFKGDPELTQTLTLAKLTMDCLGGSLSAFLARTDLFGWRRPRHWLLIVQLVLRSILLPLILTHVLGVFLMPHGLFLCVWCLHFFVGAITNTQIDVSVVRFSPLSMRKVVTRRNVFSNFTGLALSLAVAVIFFVAF